MLAMKLGVWYFIPKIFKMLIPQDNVIKQYIIWDDWELWQIMTEFCGDWYVYTLDIYTKMKYLLSKGPRVTVEETPISWRQTRLMP